MGNGEISYRNPPFSMFMGKRRCSLLICSKQGDAGRLENPKFWEENNNSTGILSIPHMTAEGWLSPSWERSFGGRFWLISLLLFLVKIQTWVTYTQFPPLWPPQTVWECQKKTQQKNPTKKPKKTKPKNQQEMRKKNRDQYWKIEISTFSNIWG